MWWYTEIEQIKGLVHNHCNNIILYYKLQWFCSKPLK